MILLLTIRNQLAFGPRILHAVLQEHGYSVTSLFVGDHFLDPRPLSNEQVEGIVDHICGSGYCMVGISLTSYAYMDAKRISVAVRKRRADILLVWGGHHPTIAAEECVEYADYVCRGEAEEVIVKIAQALKEGDYMRISGMNNIAYRDRDGQFISNPIASLEQDMDSIPVPDFSNTDKLYLYDSQISKVVNEYDDLTEYYLMTSRGCPYLCKFCCVSYMRVMNKGGGKFLRRRSVESVISELKQAKINQPSLSVIYFYDDVFLYDLRWLTEFSRQYKQEIGLPFWCYGYINIIREEMLAVLKDAGLYAMSMGIQSGSERVRKEIYARPESNQKLLKAAQMVNRQGIHMSWDLICGPFDTLADKQSAFELFYQLPKPYKFHFHPLSYYRNLGVTEMALNQGFIDESDIIGQHTKLTQSITDLKSFIETDDIINDPYWRLLKLFGKPDISNETIESMLNATASEVVEFIQKYDRDKQGHQRIFSEQLPSMDDQSNEQKARPLMSGLDFAPEFELLESRLEGRAKPADLVAPNYVVSVNDNWL